MAKVKGPLGSIEARGSVGAYTYSSWKGFSTVRSRTAPGARPPGRRETLQGYMTNAAAGWATISSETRQLWYELAQRHTQSDWSGTPMQIPAWNWWIRVQMIRLVDDLAASDLPPSTPPLWVPAQPVASFLEGILYVDWNVPNPADSGQHYAQIWLTNAHSAGRHATLHDAHWAGTATADDGEKSFSDLPNGTYTAFVRPISFEGFPGSWQSTICNPEE